MRDVGVAVIGGGITGLAAALRLHERVGDAGWLLLEAEHRLGGKIRTERRDGLVIEGGPDCFLAAKPGGMAFCRALDLTERLRGTNPACRRTYITRRGRLHELPEGLSGLVPSRLGLLLRTQLLSPMGRFRAGLELFVPRGAASRDESIAAFVTRRFGAEAWHWLVEPLLAGIFAGDGTRLSVQATFPRLLVDEQREGSVLRALMKRRPAGTDPGPGFVTLSGGLAELVEAAVARLPTEAWRTGVRVAALDRTATGYRLHLADGGEVVAERVILATPAFASAALLKGLAPELARELAAIPYVSTATVSLTFPVRAIPRPLDGYGYVSPRAEGGPIVACTWTSNKFPGRVPDGQVLIRFFLGRAGEEDIVAADDDTLVGTVRAELSRRFGVRASPATASVFRWPRGMPQYHVGHGARLERIDRLVERLPGIALAGAAYRGVGIPDCITQGWAAADRVLPRVPAEVA